MLRNCVRPTALAVGVIVLSLSVFGGCHPFGGGDHRSGMYHPSAARDEQIRKKAQKDKFPAAGEPVTDAVTDVPAQPPGAGR